MSRSSPHSSPRERAAELLLRAVGTLSTAAMARMDQEKAWFRDLSAEDRSWVGTIVQAGVSGFADWFRGHPDSWALSTENDTAIAADVFGVAPRTLTGVINLQQTVELIRLTIDVAEENIDRILGPELAPMVHEALLRYGREVAFATADVYARTAEARGAWDARLEALVVDSVLRSEPDETVLSRASALGWGGRGDVMVVLGQATAAPQVSVFDDVRRSARAAGMDALCAVQGDRMVVVLGGVDRATRAVGAVAGHFAAGPLVHGPATPDLSSAHRSARAAVSAFNVAHAWPDAPRPVSADDLLTERALSGDEAARIQLVDDVYRPLTEARGTLIETLDAWFAHSGSIEGTARALFVHPNTVRYRLRQATDVTGLALSNPRQAQTYAVALVLGRLASPSA